MARMKFLCDAERCIECNGCVTACKNENDIPWGVNRRRVVTINDGDHGERSISVACMHCSDAPCATVCPVDCFYTTNDGVVLHDKDICIGCGYCFYACPFGAPQFPETGAFGSRGTMDKCTFCAGGPEQNNSAARTSQVRGKPACRRQTAVVCGNVLLPRPYWPAMVTGSRISSVNVSCIVVLGHFSGAGELPTTSRVLRARQFPVGALIVVCDGGGESRLHRRSSCFGVGRSGSPTRDLGISDVILVLLMRAQRTPSFPPVQLRS